MCVFGQTLRAEYVFSPNDYAVYSAILDEWLGHTNQTVVLVRQQTATGCSVKELKEELPFVASRMAGLRRETMNDFLAKNIHSYPLDPDYLAVAQTPHGVISPEEIGELFRYEDGWKRLYQRYPHCNGIATFSRVGFNRYGKQALVYVGLQWDDFSGAGAYLLLNRDDAGRWGIQQQVRAWHSWLPEEQDFPFPHGPEKSQPIL